MNLLQRAKNALTTSKQVMALAMVLALGFVMTSPVMASTALGAGAAAEIAGTKAIIVGLLVTLVAIVFLFVAYGFIKRAK